MKKPLIIIITSLTLFGIFLSCKKSEEQEGEKQTIITGKASIIVDESFMPIVEDQINVFEHTYKANLNLTFKSEGEVINDLIEGESNLAVLSRMLTDKEEKHFKDKNITPKITRFVIDGIAFISNKKDNDSLIDLNQIIAYIKGEQSTVKNLVFDNINSSASRILHQKANTEIGFNKNVYSKSSSEELLRFISENEGNVGVIGINWITQTPTELLQHTEKITVLSVKNVKTENSDDNYYFPSQANIGKKLYPLTREIYLLNYQGTSGLGMGFASFIASDIGQKIILTSGLAPMEVDQLQINIKKDIN